MKITLEIVYLVSPDTDFMNILFLSYWGIHEGLTAATVFPHLDILADLQEVEKIILVTIERDFTYQKERLSFNEKTRHSPLVSKRPLPNIINKIYDFIEFPQKLEKLCRKEAIDKIIARGAPPGALAMKVSRRTGIPFYVESFEPHSAYMYESGTWLWFDPRYFFQKRWERQQYKEATALMPVADNYKKLLVAEGVESSKIDVIPCCVPLEDFVFSDNDRNHIRHELRFNDKLLGIYTGKFGGIYYREESFLVFKHAFEHFKDNFCLIILTPDSQEWVSQMIRKYHLPADRVFSASVSHALVPSYLSASDFAFSLQSPKKSNLYLSPIKNAEYWANGLPVLMTSGVGDDASIMESENAGAVFRGVEDKVGIRNGLDKIQQLVKEQGVRKRLFKLAAKHRNFERVREVYRKWYGTV